MGRLAAAPFFCRIKTGGVNDFSVRNLSQIAETAEGSSRIMALLLAAVASTSLVVGGIGTGGTIMGVAKYMREKSASIKLHPLEPAESPTLSTGCKVGSHRIQGISDEFIPAICELDSLDEIITVSDGDSILMAQKLAAELGLGVGISSGANFLGALTAREKLGKDAVVATVFADDNKKYLSTDLVKNQPVRENYLSPHIELFGYQTIGRINRNESFAFN